MYEEIIAKIEADGITCIWSKEAETLRAGLSYKEAAAIDEALRLKRVRADWEASDASPAVKHYVISQIETNPRGIDKPEKRDLSWMLPGAKGLKDQWGKPRAEFPDDEAFPLTVEWDKALSFRYTQEAYADYAEAIVPVSGEIMTDLTETNSHFYQLARRNDTHTGWAGSGSNHEASLVSTPHGLVLVVTSRHSIGD